MPSKMTEPYIGTKCPHCEEGKMVETEDSNEWWTECDSCGADIFCYNPMPHQLAFHLDEHKFKLYAGGFG